VDLRRGDNLLEDAGIRRCFGRKKKSGNTMWAGKRGRPVGGFCKYLSTPRTRLRRGNTTHSPKDLKDNKKQMGKRKRDVPIGKRTGGYTKKRKTSKSTIKKKG